MRQDQEEAVRGLVGSLDESLGAAGLANRANYSTAQFYRLVKKGSADPPMTVRRRLLLERAAFQLTAGATSVTEIAFDAGFESLEGFSRAFKKGFGVSARNFRRLRPSDYRLDAAQRIHFALMHGPAIPPRQGEQNMKLFELLIDHHRWSMQRILDRCSALSDEQLDEEISARSPFPWDSRNETVRKLLEASVAFACPWLETINGIAPEFERSTLEGMSKGLAMNCEEFKKLVSSIEEEGRWDLTFVDSLCEPPEVFSYGGVVGHVVTYNAYRRVLLINELKKFGINDVGFGDPLEFDDGRRETA